MPIKLIATDMDGTFLHSDHHYNQALFKRVFRQLKRRQIRFVAASGSSFPRLARDFAAYQDAMDFVSQNGSVIHHGTQLVKAWPIEVTALERVLHILDRFYGPEDINELVVSSPLTSYVDQRMDAKHFQIVKLFYERVVRVPDLRQIFKSLPTETFTKISVCFAPHVNVNKAIARLDGYLPPALVIENSGFNTALIGNAKGTKQNALMLLQDQLHIQSNELVTFGDNENDLGMLAMTDQSFAMKNALPVVQLQAAHTTVEDNDHDGVLTTIQKLVKNNR